MPGSDGDITIIDPDGEWEVKEEDMLSVARWSPFTGMKLTGKIVTTIVRGVIVYNHGKIVDHAGHGKFVAPVK